jgi:beta-lactamase superfamily II metal-dependent hydrolase
MPAMKPPPNGIKVRMYRQGHGDCFLLTTKKKDGNPFYMLIDCGLWRKSEINDDLTIDKIVDSIRDATSGRLDVVLITHEHEDHVNGFAATREDGSDCWSGFKIGEIWLAWTEDGTDDDANALRTRFDDVLFGLAGAIACPHGVNFAAEDRLQMIRDLLALHTGEPDVEEFAKSLPTHQEGNMALAGGLAAVPGVRNKKAIQKMRDAAEKGVRFLDPAKGPYTHNAVEGMRVFALGPPRNVKLLLSLDPKGAEEFKFQLERPSLGLLQAFSTDPDELRAGKPFSPRHGTSIDRLADDKPTSAEFFRNHHGYKDEEKAGAGPIWRRIDNDWLDSAEALAMRLNDEVNNTSLVIAIEMPETRKVLLFTGDAQRGNWISWSDLEWKSDAGKTVTARELLGRTVFYKVGHHGSHNATLKGQASDAHANLGWFGLGEHAQEFVAMIPANKEWAFGKARPWKHPLKAIEEALVEKARGRVFRTDEAGGPKRPDGVSVEEWERFTSRVKTDDLYFDYVVADS